MAIHRIDAPRADVPRVFGKAGDVGGNVVDNQINMLVARSWNVMHGHREEASAGWGIGPRQRRRRALSVTSEFGRNGSSFGEGATGHDEIV